MLYCKLLQVVFRVKVIVGIREKRSVLGKGGFMIYNVTKDYKVFAVRSYIVYVVRILLQ